MPYIGKKSDVLNKKACVLYFQPSKRQSNHIKNKSEWDDLEAKRKEQANQLWVKAISINNTHFYSLFNLGVKKFHFGEITAEHLLTEFNDDVFMHR